MHEFVHSFQFSLLNIGQCLILAYAILQVFLRLVRTESSVKIKTKIGKFLNFVFLKSNDTTDDLIYLKNHVLKRVFQDFEKQNPKIAAKLHDGLKTAFSEVEDIIKNDNIPLDLLSSISLLPNGYSKTVVENVFELVECGFASKKYKKRAVELSKGVLQNVKL